MAASVGAAPPSNDNFASAEVLSGPQPIVARGTTREATREPGDPTGLPPSVWYSWTPPASGRIAIEYCAENEAAAEDLTVSLLRGDDRATLQYVPTNLGNRPRSGDCPFAETGLTLPERYEVVGGAPYRIEVGGNPSMQGSFAFVITRFTTPPPNDEFAGAETLDRALPARAVGDPTDSDDGILWYRWTAPRSGSFTVEVCGEPNVAGEPSLEVFTGASEGALDSVAMNSVSSLVGDCPLDRQPNADGLAFRAVAGTTYRLRVAADPYAGRFGLALKPEEVYDLAVDQSVSRRSIPAGGVVVVKLTVTNRSNITVPTRADPRLGFSQSINKPAFRNDPGKGRYLSVRSPGARCSKGFFFKVPVAGCAVKRLAPGERMVATMRIRVLASILLEVENDFSDDRRRNDEPRTVVRARR
jgi:hypothetical protein